MGARTLRLLQLVGTIAIVLAIIGGTNTSSAKTQKDLDSVIGRDRLPTLNDKKALPYVEAVCREVLRWHSVIPLGVGHQSMCDDVYDGHLIPKGNICFSHILRAS